VLPILSQVLPHRVEQFLRGCERLFLFGNRKEKSQGKEKTNNGAAKYLLPFLLRLFSYFRAFKLKSPPKSFSYNITVLVLVIFVGLLRSLLEGSHPFELMECCVRGRRSMINGSSIDHGAAGNLETHHYVE
jgi:hypothetical protein